MREFFDSLAGSYDRLFTGSFVGRSQRNVVWREMDRLFQPGQRVLEINCGTGVDAAHLAQRGVRVFACDGSARMTRIARERAAALGLDQASTFHTVPTEELDTLAGQAPFDGLLSNFAGLNCVSNLESSSRSLARLLRRGANALLCVFGKCCAWEIAWNLAHANIQKGFRRFNQAVEVDAGRGESLSVHYWSVGQLKRAFSHSFRLKHWGGAGITVPPSYLDSLTTRFPAIFRLTAKLDLAISNAPIARAMADHVLLTFERL